MTHLLQYSSSMDTDRLELKEWGDVLEGIGEQVWTNQKGKNTNPYHCRRSSVFEAGDGFVEKRPVMLVPIRVLPHR